MLISKEDDVMNKKVFLVSLLIIIISILISVYFVFFTRTDGEILEIKENNNKEIELYTKKDYEIYFIGIESIKIKYNRLSLELKEYLKKNRNIDEVLELLDKLEEKDYNVYTNSKIKVIKCKNIKKVYIGNKTLEYQNEFCS